MIKVKSVSSNLIIDSSEKDFKLIISDQVLKGVAADIVIFPFIDESLGDSTVAAATYCITETYSNRPLAGFISFNKKISFEMSDSLMYYDLLV